MITLGLLRGELAVSSKSSSYSQVYFLRLLLLFNLFKFNLLMLSWPFHAASDTKEELLITKLPLLLEKSCRQAVHPLSSEAAPSMFLSSSMEEFIIAAMDGGCRRQSFVLVFGEKEFWNGEEWKEFILFRGVNNEIWRNK